MASGSPGAECLVRRAKLLDVQQNRLKFSVLTVSDKLCICDVSYQTDQDFVYSPEDRGIKAAEGNGPPGGGGGRWGLTSSLAVAEQPAMLHVRQ